MIKGEMMVPMRAAMEQQPIAVLLMTVGKSSDENVYTTQNADVMPNLPKISNNTGTISESIRQ